MKVFLMPDKAPVLNNTASVDIPEAPDTSASVFLLKERFEIHFSQPLPEFNSNGALAYEAIDKTDISQSLFALVCSNNTPRLSYLPYMKSIDSPYIMKLVEYGHVEYQDSETIALIYQKPEGARADSFFEKNISLNFDKFRTLALSLISGCDILKSIGLTHRAIRLDNLFFTDSSCSELMLGDCLAAFPSTYQPLTHETVENSLCEPQSRGNGSIDNDMYALGVVLLELVLNHKITSDLSALEMLKQKLNLSSFAYLSNNEKMHNRIAAILKMMLDDNNNFHFDYNTLVGYLDGKNINPHHNIANRSSKALIIDGEKYYTLKTVALAILLNPETGYEIIQNGKLLDWLKIGLENEKTYEKLQNLLNVEKNETNQLQLINKVCIYLDSSLPLKYGDSYIFPDGIAKTIFYNKKHNIPLNQLQSLISGDCIKLWYQEQPFLRAPSNSNEFSRYISRNDYGYGLERIMYDFDDDLPCISSLLGKSFVTNISQVLNALNNNRSNFSILPFDKTIIAYLRCKMGKKIDKLVSEINASQDAVKISAILHLYANIQNKQGPVKLVNLTHWLATIAKPVVQSYHNTKYQKYLEHEIIKISRSGKIIDLISILENEEAKERDQKDFSEALKNVNFLLTEKNKILNGDTKIDDEARDSAARFSSMLSVLTMLSTFVFSLIYWIIKQ